LVTEWIDGVPLSEVIADGTQELRDRAGQLLARFLFSGPAAHGLLHADPIRATSGCCPGTGRESGEAGQWRLGVLDFARWTTCRAVCRSHRRLVAADAGE